ncbi:hypothetical protein [Sphingobacterium mizutaii]|uniref:hypothetical protein n=1 Tax=Sphingobacterium mizutaii TaxID=1010 RepID=UPI0016262223|nr:hypothetical protein [Sphingobacterium mizutaii]
MAHKEKLFKLENGGKIRVEVDFHFDGFRYKYDKTKGTMSYYAFVTYIEKGKKNGVRENNDEWLSLIQETALELWMEFKPNFLQA